MTPGTTLTTKRLRFINASPEILQKMLQGNVELAAHLGIVVPDHWTEFGDAPFVHVLKMLGKDPASQQWWTWLPILKDENKLIGNCGYKGPPQNGSVEIGYEVIQAYRGIGLATEIAACLVDHAFNFPEVKQVIAHTLPAENASCKVLKKCGFLYNKEIIDPEDGLVWQWTLLKDE
jgi:RimJ/RimL family protein N-acetyltransferase